MSEEVIQHSDFVDPRAVPKLIADMEAYLAVVIKTEQGIRDLLKASGQVLGKNPTSVSELKTQQAEIDKITAAEKSQIAILLEKERIQKRILEFKSALRKADKEEADAKKRLADEQRNANKLSREEIAYNKQRLALAKAEVGSLNEMKARLSLVTAQYNKMNAARRENSATGKMLLSEQKALTDALNRSEQAGGNFHRQVGAYHLAVGKLGKGIKGLTGILGELGILFGFNVEAMETVVNVGSKLNKTLKEIHHAENLKKVATQESTAATHAQAAATEASTLAEEGNIAAKEAEIVVTEELTIAQRILNAVKNASAGQIGLVVAGVALVVGVIYELVEANEAAEKAEEEKNKAVDGTIIKSKELREEHNKSVYELQRLELEYEELAGNIDKTGAAMKRLEIDYNEALTKIAEEGKEKMAATVEGIEGFKNATYFILSGGDATKLAKQQLDIQKDIALKIADETKKFEAKKKIEREKKDKEILFDADQLNLKLKKINDGYIKDEHDRRVTELNDEAQLKILSVQQSSDYEEIKANKITEINAQLQLDLYQQELKHNEDLDKARKEREKMYIADRDARIKAEDEKYQYLLQLKKRIEALEYDLKPEQTAEEAEQERYEKQLEELNRIAEDAKDAGKFSQERYDRDAEAIERKHMEELGKILDEGNLKQGEQIEDDNKKRIALDKGLYEEKKKLLEENIKDAISAQEKLLDAVKQAYARQDKLRDAYNSQRSAQINEDIQVQQQQFNAGLDNTLAYEKAERAKFMREQLIEKRKQQEREENIQLASLFLELEKTYASEGLAGAAKAFAQTMAAKGIASAIAGSAFEGVEDTGDGNGRGVDGKGGSYWILHPKERVLPKNLNEKIDGMSNEELVEKALAFENIYLPQMSASLIPDEVGQPQPWGNEALILNGFKELGDKLEKGLRGINSTTFSYNDQKQFVEDIFRDGVRKQIFHQRPRSG